MPPASMGRVLGAEQWPVSAVGRLWIRSRGCGLARGSNWLAIDVFLDGMLPRCRCWLEKRKEGGCGSPGQQTLVAGRGVVTRRVVTRRHSWGGRGNPRCRRLPTPHILSFHWEARLWGCFSLSPGPSVKHSRHHVDERSARTRRQGLPFLWTRRKRRPSYQGEPPRTAEVGVAIDDLVETGRDTKVAHDGRGVRIEVPQVTGTIG